MSRRTTYFFILFSGIFIVFVVMVLYLGHSLEISKQPGNLRVETWPITDNSVDAIHLTSSDEGNHENKEKTLPKVVSDQDKASTDAMKVSEEIALKIEERNLEVQLENKESGEAIPKMGGEEDVPKLEGDVKEEGDSGKDIADFAADNKEINENELSFDPPHQHVDSPRDISQPISAAKLVDPLRIPRSKKAADKYYEVDGVGAEWNSKFKYYSSVYSHAGVNDLNSILEETVGIDGEVDSNALVKLVKLGIDKGYIVERLSARNDTRLSSLYDVILQHFNEGNHSQYVEVGVDHKFYDQTIAYTLAQENRDILSVFVGSHWYYDSDYWRDTPLLRPAYPENFYWVQNNRELPHKNMNCIQFIDSFEFLVGDLLPFEYEEYLHTTLCRCNITYVPAYFPAVSDSPFFSNWGSVSEFVNDHWGMLDSSEQCTLKIDKNSAVNKYLGSKSGRFIAVERAPSKKSSSSSIKLADSRGIDGLFTAFDLIVSGLVNTHFSKLFAVFATQIQFSTNDLSFPNPFSESLLRRYVVVSSKYVDTADDIYDVDWSAVDRNYGVAYVKPLVNPEPEPIKKINADNPNAKSSTSTPATGTSSSRLTALEDSKALPSPPSSSKSALEKIEGSRVLLSVEDEVVSWPNAAEYDEYFKTYGLRSIPSDRDSMSLKGKRLVRSLQARENDVYRYWMTKLDTTYFLNDKSISPLSEILKFKAPVVFMFGRHISLLSVKLSKLLMQEESRSTSGIEPSASMVVSMLMDQGSKNGHIALLNSFDLMNNVLSIPSFSFAWVDMFLQKSIHSDFSIFQADFVLNLISLLLFDFTLECNAIDETFGEVFSSLLSAGNVVYIEMPSRENLIASFLAFEGREFSRECLKDSLLFKDDQYQSLFRQALSYNSEKHSVHDISCDSERPSTLLFRIELLSDAKPPNTAIVDLVDFGLIPEYKSKVFKMLLDFPADNLPEPGVKQMPANQLQLKVASSRVYGPDQSTINVARWLSLDYLGVKSASCCHTVSGPSFRQDIDDNYVRNFDDLIRMDEIYSNEVFEILNAELSSNRGELAGGKFSLVEHGSKNGYLSVMLAKMYPAATILSLGERRDEVWRHKFLLEKFNITNNYVTWTNYEKVVKNLYESPEFFRFQIIHDLNRFFASFDESVRSPRENIAGTAFTDVGSLLSTSLTSFVRVPTAEVTAWAFALMFTSGYIDPKTAARSFVSYRGFNGYVKFDAKPFKNFEINWILGQGRLPSSGVVDRPGGIPKKDESKDKPVEIDTNSGEFVVTSPSLTKLSITPLFIKGKHAPYVRVDVTEMIRHVHHHYDYAKDGHKRTYTMKVNLNTTATDQLDHFAMHAWEDMEGSDNKHKVLTSKQDGNGILLFPAAYTDELEEPYKFGEELPDRFPYKGPILLPSGYHPTKLGVSSVHLYRDRDFFPIPYVSIYGITLITALRLGIIQEQADRLYKSFLQLHLYEDMAPWNIVLMGSSVDYIDYDTRDMHFDLDIPKAYQIMSVMMNYKRTLEDFGKCGGKGETVYGLPYVSDCVGITRVGKFSFPSSCPDLKLPVPCGDGECHSDYISCLRSFSRLELSYSKAEANLLPDDVKKSGKTIGESLGFVSLDSNGVKKFAT